MLKKNKKFTLLLSGLAGALLVSSVAGVALSSCTTTSNSTTSSDVQYSYVIDWNDKDLVDRLIIDNSGLVYSDNSKTTVIAISPKVNLTTVKIPSQVKSIMGYSKVVYQKISDSSIVDQIPTDGNASDYIKVYQSYGAFQNMLSLENVILETGSQLQSIGGLAFSGCTTLKSITGLSSSLNFVGSNAFTNCINLESINTTNVVKVGNNAFLNCTNLNAVDLSSAIYIGNNAFQNCSNLNSIGSLEKVVSLGQSAFSGAIKNNANISIKLSNLLQITESAFANTQGIAKIDFSGNTLLTTIAANAFIGSTITEVDFTGCSKLSSIGDNSFQNCANLTTVYLPNNEATSLTSIGNNAFADCANLTIVNVKGATSGFAATSKLSSIGNNFLGNTSITSVDLSNFVISSSNSTTNPLGSQTPLAFISNLKSVTLPSTIKTLNAGLFYRSGFGTAGGFSLDLPSSITNLGYTNTLDIYDTTNNLISITNGATPFRNTGIVSIDMSKITSYQSTTGNETIIPDCLFYNTSKLESVVLKTDTTQIGVSVFQGTSSLMSVAYPSSSDTTTIASTTNGFVASSSLTTIGANAFNGAFSTDSNAIVDLSQMSLSGTTAPAAFNHSKVATLKLPSTIVTINANSFDNMTKLASVNFEDLTNLTTIYKSNFTNTQLTSIDLSKTKFATINDASAFGGTNQLFTNLPSSSIVALPTTLGNFTGVFTDTNNNYVTFSYPNGISSSLLSIDSNGVMTFVTNNVNTNLTTNASILNLLSSSNIKSIGTNTFFGSKLSSLTLPASGIANNTNIFTAANITTPNASNTTDVSSSSYIKANVPFGNNETFTSLNYTGFTQEASAANTIADATPQQTLFNTTNNTTWQQIAKIINSLSYQTSATSSQTAQASKANISSWTADTANNGTSIINQDVAQTWTASTDSTPASIKLSNSYTSTTDTTTTDGITISATDATKTIVHNGITWTYTNDGSTIKLVGSANMYKATNGSNNYLVFFNQSTYSETGGTTIYYVPNKQSVNVTLTIATASNSATK